MKFQTIDVSKIKEDPGQPREVFDQDEITNLARWMAEVGDKDPVKVVALGDGKFRVHDGARRFLAHQKNGTKKLRCIVFTEGEDPGLAGQIATDAHKVKLSPAEQIRATAKYAKDNPSDMHTICLATGRSSASVEQDLKLSQLPVDMLLDLNEGTMDRGALLDMIERVEPDEWAACYKQMKSGNTAAGRKAKTTAYLKNKSENSVEGDEDDVKLTAARKVSDQLFNKVTKLNGQLGKGEFTLDHVFKSHKKDMAKLQDHVKALSATAKLVEKGLKEYEAQTGKPV